MKQVKEDVKKALELIKEKNDSRVVFDKYSTPFIFGTENQEGIDRVIDYQDRDVLTVASSADQYLGAAYYGAKKN